MSHLLFPMCRFLYITLLAVTVVGCGNQPADGEYEKVEHFVPAHWPSDLLDASSKITERALRLSGQSTTDTPTIENQLRDIVGWVPEIAADTDLTEAQWNPVYEASEALSKRLAKMPRPLDDATLGAIDQYCQMLTATAARLPAEEVVEPLEESLEESQ